MSDPVSDIKAEFPNVRVKSRNGEILGLEFDLAGEELMTSDTMKCNTSSIGQRSVTISVVNGTYEGEVLMSDSERDKFQVAKDMLEGNFFWKRPIAQFLSVVLIVPLWIYQCCFWNEIERFEALDNVKAAQGRLPGCFGLSEGTISVCLFECKDVEYLVIPREQSIYALRSR